MITDTLKDKSIAELEEIAQKLRDKIIDVVSQKGGHFSSPLGAVELTIGMHRVFDAKSDPLIFDVSHQAYPHKLLTDRWDNFHT
jgi:1-deoxy-D-xylulose-5-phosphate synthase